MSTNARLLGALALAGAVVAACAGAGATPDPTTPAQPTAVPTPTPVPSIEPMAPAHVTGTGNHWSNSGTQTPDGDVTHIRDIVVRGGQIMSDPRVTGDSTVNLSVDAVGSVGWEWGDATLKTDAGTWNGTCTAAVWDSGNGSEVSCWFTGSGPYEGLTYYEHISTTGGFGTIEGVILPVPAPAT